MFGHKLTGSWAVGDITILMYSDRYTFSVMEQLLFRLSNVEGRVTIYVIDKSRRGVNFTKRELRSGGLMGAGESIKREDYYYTLVDKFPLIKFRRMREVDIDYKYVVQESGTLTSIISLGVDIEDAYKGYINQWAVEEASPYILNTQRTFKYIQLMYGVNAEGNSQMDFIFNHTNGYLTERHVEGEYEEPRTLEQTHELRIMLNLVLNDLLTERTINYDGLSMVDDEIIRHRLSIPTLSMLQQSYIYRDHTSYQDIEELLSQSTELPEGYRYSSSLEDSLVALRNVVTTIAQGLVGMYAQSGRSELSNLMREFEGRVFMVSDKGLLSRWLQTLLQIQQTLTIESVYEQIT